MENRANGNKTRDEMMDAATVVNHAVLKCLLAGLPIDHDNIIRMVGNFADPGEPENASLIEAILALVDDMVETVVDRAVSRSPLRHFLR